ncbi:FAD/NAD(P)-binding domain-containing protein [Nemania abortiva]|nr:FAD/NAD(P)-binding domain-containing protein [Nemania abortiva]
MAYQPPVLIIGADVAGLTLAQGLCLHSVAFRLFERHPRSRVSQGHRFRIYEDGRSALDSVLSQQFRLPLRGTAAKKHRFEPRYIDASKLNYSEPTPVDPETIPLGRTWICQLLFLNLDDAIEYEKGFECYEIIDGQVHAKFTDSSIACGRILVGADGVKSRVRKQLQPDRKLLDLERWIIWGRTPLTVSLQESLPPDLLTWCMYLDREANVQAVVEPVVWSRSVSQVSGHRLPDFHNYVYRRLCAAPYQYGDSLSKTTEEKELYLLVNSAAYELSACVPVMSSKQHIEIRSAAHTGYVTLVGDAAHPMSPMGGSGADTTVRNVADLAWVIAEEGVTRHTLAQFESRMGERAKEKIEHSFRGGQKFWRGKE